MLRWRSTRSGSIGSIVRADEGVAVGYLHEAPGGEGHGDPLGVFVAADRTAFGTPELVDDQPGSYPEGLKPPGLGRSTTAG